MSTDKLKSKLTIVSGNNFSGRSKHLKSIIDSESGIFIGEQPNSAITGIFPTVQSEIKFHSNSTDTEVLSFVNSLFEQYNFQINYDKNPFTLSGGEQAILALLSAILLQPKQLAIDCTIEQLNKTWREPLLNAIEQGFFSKTDFFLADNRFKEYRLNDVNVVVPNNNSNEHKFKIEKPCISEIIETSNSSTIIDLSDINFYYNKNQPIFQNINLQLLPREIYFLSGNNGTGKTTLAKILTGILRPQSGTILVNAKKYNAYRFPGQLVGYSFQNPDEQLFSTTIENEVLPILKNETSAYRERRETFLEMFGLQNIKKEHPSEMPFVIRKRIALAATLALDRSWYILDEPTLGQDDDFGDFLLTLLVKLKEVGKGIVIISHSEKFTNNLDSKKIHISNLKLNMF